MTSSSNYNLRSGKRRVATKPVKRRGFGVNRLAELYSLKHRSVVYWPESRWGYCLVEACTYALLHSNLLNHRRSATEYRQRCNIANHLKRLRQSKQFNDVVTALLSWWRQQYPDEQTTPTSISDAYKLASNSLFNGVAVHLAVVHADDSIEHRCLNKRDDRVHTLSKIKIVLDVKSQHYFFAHRFIGATPTKRSPPVLFRF